MFRTAIKSSLQKLMSGNYQLRRLSVKPLKVDFGNAATEYGKHRHGLPLRFFEELKKNAIGLPNQKILDIGTGTGDTARHLAKNDSIVVGIDPSEKMIQQAQTIDRQHNVCVTYQVATAEYTKQLNNDFDAVTAIQAYHWFDRSKAIPEILRVIKPNGQFVIASYDWKTKTGASWISETLIRKYNPKWQELDFYTQPHLDLTNSNFRDIRKISFMHKEQYSQDDWIGRTCTSYGVGPSLPVEEVQNFKKELALKLNEKFSNASLDIWHHCHILISRPPQSLNCQTENNEDGFNLKHR